MSDVEQYRSGKTFLQVSLPLDHRSLFIILEKLNGPLRVCRNGNKTEPPNDTWDNQ